MARKVLCLRSGVAEESGWAREGRARARKVQSPLSHHSEEEGLARNRCVAGEGQGLPSRNRTEGADTAQSLGQQWGTVHTQTEQTGGESQRHRVVGSARCLGILALPLSTVH